MKKIIQYSPLFIAFILLSATSTITLESLMNKFNQTYDKEFISMDIEIEAIESASKAKVTIEKSSVLISKKSFYQKKVGSEIFIDKKYEINVNKQLKTISVSHSGGLNNRKIKNYSMDSIAKKMKNQMGATITENSNNYSVNFSIDYYTAEYFISKSDYTLNQVKYKFNEGYAYTSMNISYGNYKFDKEVKHKIKKIGDFIQFKRGTPIASKNYSNYTIQNRLK